MKTLGGRMLQLFLIAKLYDERHHKIKFQDPSSSVWIEMSRNNPQTLGISKNEIVIDCFFARFVLFQISFTLTVQCVWVMLSVLYFEMDCSLEAYFFHAPRLFLTRKKRRNLSHSYSNPFPRRQQHFNMHIHKSLPKENFSKF